MALKRNQKAEPTRPSTEDDDDEDETLKNFLGKNDELKSFFKLNGDKIDKSFETSEDELEKDMSVLDGGPEKESDSTFESKDSVNHNSKNTLQLAKEDTPLQRSRPGNERESTPKYRASVNYDSQSTPLPTKKNTPSQTAGTENESRSASENKESATFKSQNTLLPTTRNTAPQTGSKRTASGEQPDAMEQIKQLIKNASSTLYTKTEDLLKMFENNMKVKDQNALGDVPMNQEVVPALAFATGLPQKVVPPLAFATGLPMPYFDNSPKKKQQPISNYGNSPKLKKHVNKSKKKIRSRKHKSQDKKNSKHDTRKHIGLKKIISRADLKIGNGTAMLKALKGGTSKELVEMLLDKLQQTEDAKHKANKSGVVSMGAVFRGSYKTGECFKMAITLNTLPFEMQSI